MISWVFQYCVFLCLPPINNAVWFSTTITKYWVIWQQPKCVLYLKTARKQHLFPASSLKCEMSRALRQVHHIDVRVILSRKKPRTAARSLNVVLKTRQHSAAWYSRFSDRWAPCAVEKEKMNWCCNCSPTFKTHADLLLLKPSTEDVREANLDKTSFKTDSGGIFTLYYSFCSTRNTYKVFVTFQKFPSTK